MNVVEVVNEMVQLFGSMGPDHGCVIHVTEPTCMLVGHHTECHILKVLHKEVGNDR
jgi:hypothetical protein